MDGVIDVLVPRAEALRSAREAFASLSPPSGLETFAEQLGQAAHCASEAISRLLAPIDVAFVLEAMRLHHRAEAALYPLRHVLPPVSSFFVEDAFAGQLAALDPQEPREGTGLHNAANDPEQRGGFSLYVPESWQPGERLPLVVALHGGSGHGSEFLWSWLREARSRRCLLLAPTSRGSTWALNGPDIDSASLVRMVDYVDEHWGIDRERVLLSGLSDGATFTLLSGLLESSPFSALAPISGVLHPANFANGNLERARGARIYLVHGALDWMFPVALARAAAEELEKAGADLIYREIDDLSHTYPREENGAILEWLDPSLSARTPA
jgi:phospholipase/carboxylesterase